MKKLPIIIAATMMAGFATEVKAQLWGNTSGGSATFTTDNVGIGVNGLALPTDAHLHVSNAVSSSGGGQPALKLTTFQPGMIMGAPVFPNRFEVVDQAAPPMCYPPSPCPAPPPVVLDVIDNRGWFGIMQPVPQAPLHVRGNSIVEGVHAVRDNISIGTTTPPATPDATLNVHNGMSSTGGVTGVKVTRYMPGMIFGSPTFPNYLEINEQPAPPMCYPPSPCPAPPPVTLDVINPLGWLGILTPNPAAPLDVNGDARIERQLYIGDIPDGQEDPYVLTARGNSSIVYKRPFPTVPPPPAPASISLAGSILTLNDNGTLSSVSLPSGADDLGNHKATTTLNMNGNPISNATSVTANTFFPTSGSGHITGDVGGGVRINGNVGINITSAGTLMCTPLTSTARFAVSGDSRFQGALQITNNICTKVITMKDGDVTATGTVTAVSCVSTSDRAFKYDISPLQEMKDRILTLVPSQYHMKSNGYFQADDKLHFGFIAQEVENVFPNIVRSVDQEGHIGLIYDEIIPLLLQVVKEEDAIIKENTAKIADLEARLAALEAGAVSGKSQGVISGAEMLQSTLKQNVPNPFTKETVIGFNIVGGFTKAFIGIYDMNGREIQKLPVGKDATQVTFQQGKLSPGMYIYSLLVDDVLIDTKKMVVN